MKTIGSRAQVWHGTAKKTSGGLTKDSLLKNKRGKIVSRKMHALGLKAYKANKLKPATKEQLAIWRSKKSK